MAKIKRNTSKIKAGINSEPAGTNQVLHFPRAGVVTGLKEPIKVKRKKQYKRTNKK